MYNSGRKRKHKVKTRRAAHGRASTRLTSEYGLHWDATTRRQEQSDNALVNLALRWNTGIKGADAARVMEHEKQSTAKEVAMAVVRRNMLSSNTKTANEATKLLIAMESQNQKDTLTEKRIDSSQDASKQLLVQNNVYLDIPAEQLIKAKLMLEGIKEAVPTE